MRLCAPSSALVEHVLLKFGGTGLVDVSILLPHAPRSQQAAPVDSQGWRVAAEAK
jgi:hypothetical protein